MLNRIVNPSTRNTTDAIESGTKVCTNQHEIAEVARIRTLFKYAPTLLLRLIVRNMGIK
jgi:hypothetical protein